MIEIAYAHFGAYLSAHGVRGVKPIRLPRPGGVPEDQPSTPDDVRRFFLTR